MGVFVVNHGHRTLLAKHGKHFSVRLQATGKMRHKEESLILLNFKGSLWLAQEKSSLKHYILWRHLICTGCPDYNSNLVLKSRNLLDRYNHYN